MKRIFTSLLLCLLAVISAWGQREVVFDPSMDGEYSTQSGPFIIEKDGVTVSFSNGVANNSQYRVFKGSTITICSLTGNVIKVHFECTGEDDAKYGPGCFVQNVGEYAYSGKIGDWTGFAKCVTFTAVTYQVRLTKIVVTVIDDDLSAPVISPSSGTYYEPFMVTISHYNAGAHIHYTTDGSDPDLLSPEYTAPFLVDHDMTVKAIAVLDGDISSVVTANYVVLEVPSYTCFEDLESLDDGTVVRFSSPIYAVAQSNRYLFAKDDCGGFGLIYGNVEQTYSLGDVIPAGFIASKTYYSGEMELINPRGFQPASGNIIIEPETITPDQAGHDLFAHYVKVENVIIALDENGNYVAIDDDGNQIPLYFNRFDCPVPSDLSLHYDITGIIGSYGREDIIYQLLPIIIEPHGYYPHIGLGNYWNYIDPENPSATITFDYDATVIIQAGSYLYAKDETGYGLIYGNVNQTYKHGDVIPAGFGGKVTYYNGFPEVVQPFGFQPPNNQVEVLPEVVKIPQITPEHQYHYVIIKQVTIDREKGVIRDKDGNELPIFIRPGLPFTYPDDPSQLTDIRGIISYYRNQPELLVWDFEDPIPEPGHCLNEFPVTQYSSNSFRVKLVVIYQNGMNLYAQDLCEDYILMYGNVGGEFVNGDTIEGVAHWGIYQQQKQLIPVGDWVKVGHGLPVEPEDAGCTEEVSQDMCHWYVRFENVEFVTVDGKTYIEDECGRLLVYNKFDVHVPSVIPLIEPRNLYDVNGDGEVTIADINRLIDMILSGTIEHEWLPWNPDGSSYGYDVSGFLTIYNNELELYPITIDDHKEAVIIGDTNFDGELNVADVNALVDYIASNNSY